MRTSASIGKHPIHAMLMMFPIGLWQPRVLEWKEHP